MVGFLYCYWKYIVSTTFLEVLALKGYGKQPFCTTEHTAERLHGSLDHVVSKIISLYSP